MVESSEDASIGIDESKSDKVISCPMCSESAPADAIECPNCEEPFSPEVFDSEVIIEEKNSKWLFWSGLILVIIGGPGIALGSWLHDLLQIPIADYDNFDTFGWVNRMVSSVGIIILVVGIIMLILSLPKLRSGVEEEELPDVIFPTDSQEPEEEVIEESIATGDQGG